MKSSSHRRPLASALQPYVDNHSLAGAVMLVADRQGILTLEQVGFADITAEKKMRSDSLFWIASQTKPMTATALMMLVEEGKVKIEDPVEAYLPEFKGQRVIAEQDDEHVLLRKPKHPMTLLNVLTHTSGLPYRTAIEEPIRDLIPLNIAVRSYSMTPLLSEPDSQYLYSSAGINVAGRIIEVVSGRPYEEFMKSRLLDPLGMTDTAFRPDSKRLKRLAKAYKPNSSGDDLEETTIVQYTYPLNDPRRQAVPGGGLFSTAADVARFCRMILNGGTLDGTRFVSELSVARMTHKQTGDAVPTDYGLGWSTAPDSFGHGGALSTNMTIDPRRGLVFIFLVQHAGFAGNGSQALADFIATAKERFSP